jgi:hypothetical protein
MSGPDSSVGIATRYGMDGPGIESPWGQDSPHPSRPGLRPTQPPIQWIPRLSRGYSGRGVALITQPHLAPRLRQSSAIHLLPLWAFVARSRVKFTFAEIRSPDRSASSVSLYRLLKLCIEEIYHNHSVLVKCDKTLRHITW